MAKRASIKRVSSPASTGGAGNVFDQHVDACLLSLLLVRGIPPVLIDCTVVEVTFQTERLGFETDDFLLIGETGTGVRRKLLGQVKRTFTVSSSDDECKQTIEACWKDLENPKLFDSAHDRFAIVTLRGTTVLLEHFSGLLDCARACRDANGFEGRLATPGLVNKKAVSYCEEICKIVSNLTGKSMTAADVWPFLRVLHLVSWDLTTGTAQAEAMMKTLLAHTATHPDPVAVAEVTWNALLREVGDGVPQAKGYRRDDLPAEIRERHSPLGTNADRVLRALRDHSLLILGGIKDTIGGKVHLSRNQLVQEVLAATEQTQVVLVSGPAGSGKSGIAKGTIDVLSADTFAFAFRAEEFACAHLDETLQKAHVPSNGAGISAILASQGRKVLLVESVERLLESSTRSAFADLLLLVSKDPSWRIILSCRDYSTDLVRSALLESANVTHSVVDALPLGDFELQEVQAGCPKLARPLSHAPLKKLLRSPYVLDKAAQMEWPADRPLPDSERDFRATFWAEIVRANDKVADGMPRRREEAFVAIALRRARALSLYVPRAGMDEEAVNALRRDSLVTFSEDSDALLAPAHDVLEDWAILRWIEEQYAVLEGSIQELAKALGTFPAVRRTYRKWLAGLIERTPGEADRIFYSGATDTSLPAQFCDDTIVSLLRCPEASRLLGRNEALLFANDKQLLRRIIHLLRVGCVRASPWAGKSAKAASLFQIPDGVAWVSVLGIIHKRLAEFSEADAPLLLGLISDWSKGLSWQTPYPDGAEAAAEIAHYLLERFDRYDNEEQIERALQVIAGIPNGSREKFVALITEDSEDHDREILTEKLREIVLDGFHGAAACRDQPDTVIQVAKERLLIRDDSLEDEDWMMYDLLEPLFGLNHSSHFRHVPPSAIRGLFAPLLRYHLGKAVDFLIELFNHSADWYAHPRTSGQPIEAPFEITLTFSDGSEKRQWANARLWNLYRGTSVGPYVLQSALMALEEQLLTLAELHADKIDGCLLRILRMSDSVAVTSVIASVATAFPHRCGETLLTLLSSPECIMLDRGRLVGESQTGFFSRMPLLTAEEKIFSNERKGSDAKPHRSRDLESAIANLQLGKYQARVHAMLDSHRAAVPPVNEQDEEHRVWRLSIHRMDLRQYEVAPNQPDAPADSASGSPAADGREHRKLDLNVPDEDIRQMMEKSAVEYQAMSDRLALLNWATRTFDRENNAEEASKWRDMLARARVTREPETSDEGDRYLGQGGPGYIAAVCIRDHWDEMNEEDRQWCAARVCDEIEGTASGWEELDRVQRFRMGADRGCAFTVSNLVGKELEDDLAARVRQCLVLALTHPVDEVRLYAVTGVSRNLWPSDPQLAMKCVNAIAAEANFVRPLLDEELKRPYSERQSVAVLKAKGAQFVRDNFSGTPFSFDRALDSFDPSGWIGSEANSRVVTMLLGAPNEPISVRAFQRLSALLVDWWQASEDRRRGHHDREDHSFEVESQLTDALENVVLNVSIKNAQTILEPILNAIDQHPKKAAEILQGIIGIEDRSQKTEQFWAVWQLFADRVTGAFWLATVDREHSSGASFVRALFLTQYWKDDTRHWRSLEGYDHLVHSLFENLPSSATVFDSYVRFLYHIGERCLPAAFVRLAKQLRSTDSLKLLAGSNTVFMVESLLRRHVYSRPLELKQDKDIREAVLELLDKLVEAGSSAAYRMRDDFVTPISGD